MAISSKFSAVTHLELFEVAFERHYRAIVVMLSTGLAHKLVELKLFVSRERYDVNGNRVSLRNNSPAIDRILEVLKPPVAPALRSLVLVQGAQGENERMHDAYRGNARLQLDLSTLETLTLGASYSTILGGHLAFTEHFPALRKLTLCLSQHDDPLVGRLQLLINPNGAIAINNNRRGPANIFSQLTHLTLIRAPFFWRMDICRFIIEQVARGRALKYLSLPSGNYLTIKSVAAGLGPLAASLEHLRVSLPEQTADNWDRHSLRGEHFQPQAPQGPAAVFAPVFTKVTTLHLSNSPLLHSLENGLPVLAAFFPNLERLILSQNYPLSPKLWQQRWNAAAQQRYHRRNSAYLQTKKLCADCADFIGGPEAANLQQKASTTADVCKAKLVLSAVKTWPKLKTISLSIEDFLGAEEHQPEWSYLHLYETIDCTAAAAAAEATTAAAAVKTENSTESIIPIANNQQWKVEKIAF